MDTNIFVYHQAAHPDFGPDCRGFLDAVEHATIQAVTSSVVVNETIYILQIQSAATRLGTPNRPLIHARIAADPTLADETWRAAEQFLDLLEALQSGSLALLDLDSYVYREASAIGRQAGLLVSDATHVALCRQLGVAHIASNDTDLERVPFLTRWEPRR